MWKCIGPRMVKIFYKRWKVKGLTLPYFKIYNGTIIKAEKNGHIDQWRGQQNKI